MLKYLGRDGDNFRVKDTDDGSVESVDGKTLREAFFTIGIDGCFVSEDGDVTDDCGFVLVKAPHMSGRNSSLSKAKKAKNDEFYTQLSDIEAELSKYPVSAFKDKVIYCPMDVAVNTGKTMQSQFVKYFQMNAHRLQFKKLICTCLVERAAGEGESLEEVQNCYVLERVTVPIDQRNIWGRDAWYGDTNPIVAEEIIDKALSYVAKNGISHDIPYNIINQAVTAPSGRPVIVKRFVDHFDEFTGKPVFGDVDTGKVWSYGGIRLRHGWAWKYPGQGAEDFPIECYFFNDNNKVGVGVFPKDISGEPCVEYVDGGSVGLYPTEYYDYREVEYKEDGSWAEYYRHCPVNPGEMTKDCPMQSGDFRSEYCRGILESCDIVVTNPPFSLFREFIGWLIPSGKKFITLADQNCITYKEVFPLIRNNKMWVGTQTGITSMMFEVPERYPVPDYAREWCRKHTTPEHFASHRLTYLRGISWFTNIDIAKRHEQMRGLSKRDLETKGVVFHFYDNYDAMNVDKLDQIPMDYDGVMGVPITFVYKYCPEQFEIVAFRKGDDGKDLVFSREREQLFNRTFGFLFDGVDGSNYRSSLDDVLRRKEQICQDSDSPEDMKFFAEYICRHLDLAEQAVLKREREPWIFCFRAARAYQG